MIASEPQNVAAYVELAELHMASSQFHAVENVLVSAMASCGEQPALTKLMDRLRSLRAEQQQSLAHDGSTEYSVHEEPRPFPWLEAALGLCLLALLFQLVPAAWSTILNLLNFSRWSRRTWFIVSVLVLLVLIAVRIGPAPRTSTPRTRRASKKKLPSRRSMR